MADDTTKISTLPLSENLDDDDLLLVVEDGVSKKAEVGYLKEVFDGGSDVSITPSLGSGTKVADYEIDGVAGAIYVPTAPTALSQLSDDSTHRVVTDTEKSTWNGKQNALTFDDAPTASSNNPVKSNGIYDALALKANEGNVNQVVEGTLDGYRYIKYDLPANSGTTTDWEEVYIKNIPSGSNVAMTFLGYSDTNFTRLLVVGVDSNNNSTNLIGFYSNEKETKTFTTNKSFVKIRFILRRNGSYNNAESYSLMLRADYGDGLGHDLSLLQSNMDSLNANISLSGIKWDVMGDSLTNKDSVGQSAKNYVDWIAAGTGINANNVAVGGKDWWNGFLAEVSNIRSDTNIVTIFGSFNEFESAVGNLGTPTDAASSTGSFCARVKNVFNAIYAVKNDVKIGVIFPTPWKNMNKYNADATTQTNIENFLNALKSVCEMYSIPVLDLYHESMMRPWDNTFKNTYYRLELDPDTQTYVGDGVHPNENGHRYYLAPRIEVFLKSMLRTYS